MSAAPRRDWLAQTITGSSAGRVIERRALHDVAALRARAEAAGWQTFHFACEQLPGKPEFLAAAAAALGFPPYFGGNWDAFEECLADLSWLPARPRLLLLSGVAAFAARAPEDWATARAILTDAGETWAGSATPLVIALGARP